MLLLWPCWFSLAYLDIPQKTLIRYYYALFFFGSVVMRSAGCIINDLIDQDIDVKIQRTCKQGQLPQKKYLILMRILFLIILLSIGFNYLTAV